MRFAKTVFTFAGIWGVVVLTPLYFSFDAIGRLYPPAITHPDFFYGFVGVAMAWQVAFLVIGRDPARFHPLMIPAMVEKFIYVLSLSVLFVGGRLRGGEFVVALPDFVLGILFVVSFVKVDAARRQVQAGEQRGSDVIDRRRDYRCRSDIRRSAAPTDR
jgi:hypothetical protein